MRATPLLLLAACGGAGSAPEAPPLTWYRDAEPVVATHCAGCHHPGGVGPVDLTDAATAVQWAPAIGHAVERGTMPPPVSDPGCRDYVGAERLWLPDEARATLIRWVEDGAVLGDPADSAGITLPSLTLPGADVRLEPPPEGHALALDELGNEYHCFVLDNPFTETTYVTGFDVALDNRAVVHHMLLAIDRGGDAGVEFGTDGTVPSFRCQSQIVESDWSLLHAWTPGMEPVVFPEGHGMKIEPTDQLVLQMHYFGTPGDDTQEDRSAYAVRVAERVTREVYMAPFGPTGFRIPAGAAAHTDQGSIENTSPLSLRVLGAFPHMHLLGRHMRAWITSPDGETCLLDGGYDFNNQLTYMFREPVTFAPGDEAFVECTWDNSASSPNQFFDPPRDIGFGEGSNEEMCFLLTYVAP